MPRKANRHQCRAIGMIFAWGAAAALGHAAAASSAPATAPQSEPIDKKQFSYSDLADLALSAQLVTGVTIVGADRLKGDLAPGLAPGTARFLIEANTGMLLHGNSGIPGMITYIVDIPLPPGGKLPKLKKARVILIADRVVGRPQEIRLTSPYSQLDWTQANETLLRTILTDASSPAAPPFITGIGSAFHVPGAIPGESESQIFLTTNPNRPISLSILRRPGEQPQWAVALGEMVDDSARAPARDSLLWYRLACFLPAQLPDRSIATLPDADAQAVRSDYRFVLDQLGSCGRTIPR